MSHANDYASVADRFSEVVDKLVEPLGEEVGFKVSSNNEEKFTTLIKSFLETATRSYLPIIITGKKGTGKSTLGEEIKSLAKSREIVEITEESIADILQKDSLPIIVANCGLEKEEVENLNYIRIDCNKTKEGLYQQQFIAIEADRKAYDRFNSSRRVLAIGNSSDPSIPFSYLTSRRIKTFIINSSESLLQLKTIFKIREDYANTLSMDTIPPIHFAFDLDNKEVLDYFATERYKTMPSVYRSNYFVSLHSKKRDMWFPCEVAGYTITPDSYLIRVT